MQKKMKLHNMCLIIMLTFVQTMVGSLKENKLEVSMVKQCMKAVQDGDKETLEKLLTKNSRLINYKNGKGNTPLHWAVEAGHGAIVEMLLKVGSDREFVNQYGYRPLHRAAYKGHKEIVTMLLKAGADKVAASTTCQFTPLHMAVQGDNECGPVVEVLLEKRADRDAVDSHGWTALHWAAERGHRKVVDILLSAGAHKEIVCTDGTTLLHCAAGGGITSLVETLLKTGAHKEVVNRSGETPLFKAAGNGCKIIVDMLLRAGASKEAVDREGATSLHTAVFYNRREVVELLLKARAEVNALTKKRVTPLCIAAREGHTKITQLLIEAYADVKCEDEADATPLYHALTQDDSKIAQMLLLSNASIDELTSLPLKSQERFKMWGFDQHNFNITFKKSTEPSEQGHYQALIKLLEDCKIAKVIAQLIVEYHKCLDTRLLLFEKGCYKKEQ